MQYFRKALALTAAALLTCGTADRIPLPSRLCGDAAQIQAFMQSLASLSLPEEPFETLRFDRAEQQLYCDGTAVGQSYGGFTVRDGELIAEDTGLAPDSAAACTGMEYTGAGFTLTGPGLFDDLAHHDIRDRVNDLRNDRKCRKDREPKSRVRFRIRHIQHVGIEYGNVADDRKVQDRSAHRAEEIAQPFLPAGRVCRSDVRVKFR